MGELEVEKRKGSDVNILQLPEKTKMIKDKCF